MVIVKLRAILVVDSIIERPISNMKLKNVGNKLKVRQKWTKSHMVMSVFFSLN